MSVALIIFCEYTAVLRDRYIHKHPDVVKTMLVESYGCNKILFEGLNFYLGTRNIRLHSVLNLFHQP